MPEGGASSRFNGYSAGEPKSIDAYSIPRRTVHTGKILLAAPNSVFAQTCTADWNMNMPDVVLYSSDISAVAAAIP